MEEIFAGVGIVALALLISWASVQKNHSNDPKCVDWEVVQSTIISMPSGVPIEKLTPRCTKYTINGKEVPLRRE